MIRQHSLSIVLPLLMLLVACDSGSSNGTSQVDRCVARGVDYFKEIGSYPTLSSAPNEGRRAEDVARERCNRTTTAF